LIPNHRSRWLQLLEERTDFMKSYSAFQKLDRKGARRRRRATWRLRFARLGLLAVLLVAACADNQSPDALVHVIDVSPRQAIVLVGDTVELTAGPRRPGGDVVVGMPVSWITRHPQLVAVSGDLQTARVIALRAGIAEVNASAHGKIGVAMIEVRNRAPVLSEMVPAAIEAGSAGVTIVVKGSNFTPETQVTWNGSARPTQYVGTNELRAHIAASDLATAGVAQLAVVDPAPGGGTSATAPFVIRPSTVARIEVTPEVTSLLTGQAVTLAASAQNGAGDVVPAQLVWSSSHPDIAAITQLTGHSAPGVSYGVLTGARPGIATIRVAAGDVSRHFTVIVAPSVGPARITSITPDSADSSPSGLEITIRGENFTSNSGAFLNGSSRPTTFVSATELRMHLWPRILSTCSTPVRVAACLQVCRSASCRAYGVSRSPRRSWRCGQARSCS
jgi:hypothetical protein